MKIEKINISEITEYENNAKLHPREQIEQIKKSIQEFGNNDPIAIDENNLKTKAEQARTLLRIGEIDFDEAKKLVKPYIDLVNSKSKEIAKKYNQKPRLVSVSGFLR